MFLNPLHVILSFTNELAGSYEIYLSIAKCFCNRYHQNYMSFDSNKKVGFLIF